MAATNFQACLAFTLKYEGGLSNDPRDPGGRTNQGVTQAVYAAYLARKNLSPKDVFKIEPAERDEIYRNEYWSRINGDVLRAGEDLCVFDFAVNSGPARALAVWKKCGGDYKVAVDGMIHSICAHRLSFLHALRTWRAFGVGWGRRVAACEARAIRMAHDARGSPPPIISNELAAKARGAAELSNKQSTQAVVGGSVMATMAAISALNGIASELTMLGAAAVAAVPVGVLSFQSLRHGQRAAAFKKSIEDFGKVGEAAVLLTLPLQKPAADPASPDAKKD